jgi:cyclopropane fatty-acyl-phospholipid synthase-like methyltransferase
VGRVIDEDAPAQVERVKRFYDRNTARFQRLGQGGASIHRAVWAPGVTTREQAFHHVDEVVLSLLADDAAPRVVDLGCGVGGSLIYLASRRPDLVGDGVTISPAQADVAGSRIAEAGVADRGRVREGDFLAPPDDLVGADLAFSVEAFAHGPDPAAYFHQAVRLLRPGGRLVLCDDFLTAAGAKAPPRETRGIEEFRKGWRIGALLTMAEVIRHAADAGLTLVRDDDFTPYLALRRPRDRWIRLFVTATRPLRLRGEYWWSLAGGDALQYCLATVLTSYRLLVFEAPA